MLIALGFSKAGGSQEGFSSFSVSAVVNTGSLCSFYCHPDLGTRGLLGSARPAAANPPSRLPRACPACMGVLGVHVWDSRQEGAEPGSALLGFLGKKKNKKKIKKKKKEEKKTPSLSFFKQGCEHLAQSMMRAGGALAASLARLCWCCSRRLSCKPEAGSAEVRSPLL